MKVWKATMSVLWEVQKMRKLLSANFSRLWKDKVFWLCMGAMLVYSVVYMRYGCRQAEADLSAYQYSIDRYYFHFALTIGLFCALFGSMFFGTEYSDGTIRNKVIVGHKKTNLYLASLVTTMAAALLMMAVWLVGALVAVPVLGVWKMTVSTLFLYLLIAVMFVMAFSAICTFVYMISANKASTVAVSMLLVLGLFILAAVLYVRLNEPEAVRGIELTANGMEWSEPSPNPRYISGAKRGVYEFILDFLPTGQALKMWQLEINHPIRMLVSSAVITLFTTFGGIYIFKRKNIK